MSEDTTLDAFRDDDDSDEDSVEPVVSTASWSVEPVDCPRCGEAVHRRFRADDGGLVCLDCKPW